MHPQLIVVLSGAGENGVDAELQAELQVAFGGDLRPAPVMGGDLTELWRLAVEWGPQAAVWAGGALLAVKPVLDTVKVALDITDRLKQILTARPGLGITIPGPHGPIEVRGASREQVAQLLTQALAEGDRAAAREVR